jgi:predicted metal-binding protein
LPRLKESTLMVAQTILSSEAVRILVCTACRALDQENVRPGADLIARLRERLNARALSIAIADVECFAVCKRPTTVSLTAPNKWSYILGDLDAQTEVDDLIDAACSYATSETGIVPWKERPSCFKKGVVSRLPPLNGIKA